MLRQKQEPVNMGILVYLTMVLVRVKSLIWSNINRVARTSEAHGMMSLGN